MPRLQWAQEIEMSVQTKLLHDEHVDLDGNRLHVLSETANDFQVWLNTDVQDFDGLCIGYGPSRETAVANAVAMLEDALVKLRPPVPTPEEADLGIGAIPLQVLPERR
jgi:uncharacterized lipoprotein YmbA